MTQSKTYLRGLFIIILLAGLVAIVIAPSFESVRAAPQKQAATNIVISQFRVRGPNGGNDEFIELFNPTGGSVDISGWEIWGSNNTGTQSKRATIPAGKLLQSGQHFLITDSNASGPYSGSVPGDLTFATGIGDDGGIALTMPGGTPIVDQVGMTNCTGCYFEIAPLANLGTNNVDRSYERILSTNGSCVDAGNNATDFFLLTPSAPLNSSSPITACGDTAPLFTATAIAANLTSTAAANLTATASIVNITGTAASNLTATACASGTYSHHSLLINEVAWMGTNASSSDEWVELYNPGSCPIDLTGWKLTGNNYYYSTGVFTITIPAQTPALSIAPGGYFIIAANTGVFQPAFTTNFYATSTLNLADHYQSLQLFSPAATYTPVDTANNIGGYNWPAGSATTDSTMERYGTAEDGPGAWVTFASPIIGPPVTNVKDRNGVNYIHGTPGGPNWAYNIATITPSPIPTATQKPKIPTPIPPTPFAHVVINEYLPRAGFDWNNDGVIDVNDEFIEIKNNGPIDVSLSGWKLSDDPNIGNRSFTLPSQTLKAGQRAIYYGSTTHILLVDSGDTIRLSNSRGVIVDAQSYGVVKAPDQSRCRYPDGSGYWQQACFPTPGNENVLTGTIPSAPPAVIVNQPAPCLLPDTTPLEFRLAICSPFGADIWSRKFWDNSGNKFIIPDPFGKSEIILQ